VVQETSILQTKSMSYLLLLRHQQSPILEQSYAS